MSADHQLKSLMDRILRLHEAADDVKADIREVYAEAKSHGYDKTLLGKAINRVRAIEKNGDKLSEQEAIVAGYLEAYYGGHSRTHTHEAA